MYHNPNEQIARKDLWFSKVREHIYEWFNPDGSGVIPQFNTPWREVTWIMPALYTGSQEYINLANCVLSKYNSGVNISYKEPGKQHGKRFGIFQSNALAVLLNCFGDLMTEKAREVAQWHTNCVFRTFDGSAQPDYKFHGANDNMPMMATCGLILGGEALGDEQAVKHGFWNLNQVRRHLSRCAWMSEFNSSTYSAVTLAGAAKIASYSKSPEIRKLAIDIEHRLWAEILLHYHPATKMQAGPHLRAYSIDNAGHNHSLQAILWMAFGSEKLGRDIIKSYFKPDGIEVIHFCGNYGQSIAEFTDMLDCELHLPEYLAELIEKRSYPAICKGRSEVISAYAGHSNTVYTTTYMEEDFSLGSSTVPLCGGEQTNQLYATYKRVPDVKDFRDSATVFYKYFIDSTKLGEHETSADGAYTGEKFQENKGWVYTMQKDNVGLMSCIPNLKNAPIETDVLKLCIAFPGHYGKISRVIADGQELSHGSELMEVCPISLETGEVYIHIAPLLPTSLPRRAAIRFSKHNAFEVLELVNYEGAVRNFSKLELSRVFNGFVMTIDAKKRYKSLERFHAEKSDFLVLDYLFSQHRFLQFFSADVDFELVYTPEPFGVQTNSIDGRPLIGSVLESNDVDVNKLPFMTGEVERNFPFFPWKTKECVSFENSWIIGSRGLLGEYYNNRTEVLKDNI